jgi:tetratricopeptide (TPR) repeat protein
MIRISNRHRRIVTAVTVGILFYFCVAFVVQAVEDNRQLAEQALTQGQYRQAIIYFQRALRDTPDDADTRVKLAEVYGLLSNWDLATQQIALVFQQNPQHLAAKVLQAESYRAQQRWDEAKTAYQSVIAQEPDHAHAYLQLGNVLQQLGEVEAADQAMNEYERLRKLPDPE